MNKKNRDFKGIWIPKEIWLSKDLTMQEKLFLVEIDSLDNRDGCFASNGHFADFFDLSKGRCSQIISSLKDNGYIKIEYDRNGKNIEKRIIKILKKGGIKNPKGGIKNPKGGIKNPKGGIKNPKAPPLGNDKGINTNNNNTTKENSAREESANSRKNDTPVQAKNIVGQVDAADTIQELVDIYRAYRKKMGVWDNAFTIDAQQQQFKEMGIKRVKAALINSIQNGWKKLVEPDGEKEKLAAQESWDPTGRANAGAWTEYEEEV